MFKQRCHVTTSSWIKILSTLDSGQVSTVVTWYTNRCIAFYISAPNKTINFFLLIALLLILSFPSLALVSNTYCPIYFSQPIQIYLYIRRSFFYSFYSFFQLFFFIYLILIIFIHVLIQVDSVSSFFLFQFLLTCWTVSSYLSKRVRFPVELLFLFRFAFFLFYGISTSSVI